MMPRLLALFLALLFACSMLPACTIHAGGTQDPAKVADELRTQLAAAQAQLAQRDAAIAELNKKLEQATSLGAEQAQALPVVASLVIDARSGLSRTGDALEVIIQTKDGRERFMQVAGTLRVALHQEGAQPADAPLASAQLTPLQLRDAYRSGFMGTHYLVTIPMSEAIRASYAKGLVVSAQLTQVTSDDVLQTSRTLKK